MGSDVMTNAADRIQFRCPACNRWLSIAARMADRTVTCPACRLRIVVPLKNDLPETSSEGTTAAAALEVAASEEPAFEIRRRQTEIEEMDLTPMVDVTFLLLIFFMITASFSLQKTLEVPPPEPETQGASPLPLEQLEENSVVVRVSESDEYFVDDRPVDDDSALAAAISTAMKNGNRSELVIEAHDLARHESVVRVYDAGNEAEMQKIRLATRIAE